MARRKPTKNIKEVRPTIIGAGIIGQKLMALAKAHTAIFGRLLKKQAC